jgi:hypothetical protein
VEFHRADPDVRPEDLRIGRGAAAVPAVEVDRLDPV